MLGIHIIDWLVLFAYLVGVTIIGVMAANKVKNTVDFFLGGRQFRKTFMLFYSFGSGTHSDQAVSVARKTYTNGLSGIWYQWLWLFCTPFYWTIAPIFRRMRALTTGDYFNMRYGHSVAALYAGICILQLVVNIATMLKGSGAMITASTGGAFSEFWAIAILTVLFVVYGIAGGLRAAILTDFIQGILTIFLSFLVLPFALHLVGGISGLKDTIADPAMFSLVAPGEITAFYIAVIAFNGLIGIVTQPHIMSCCAAGLTEMDNRVGFCYGNMLKRFCTVAWTITGLCAIALYPGLTSDAQIDQTYGLMARDILPTIAPGLLGLFIASILAAVMSSCDAWMISSSALFTENVYKPYVAPTKSQAHYVFIGRVTAGLIILGSVAFALSLDSVIEGLETFWKIQAMMGIAFWIGLFWRRATPAAAWACTLSAFFVLLVTSNKLSFIFDMNAFAVNYLPAVTVYDGEFRLPFQMLSYLSVGAIVMVAVSLMTKRADETKLNQLYRCLNTPVQDGENPTEPFELPENSQPEQRTKIINHPDWEFYVPTKTDTYGFLFAWIWVAALIGGVYYFLAS
ncbi:MAG: sodium:solute symporter family protein [Candidatus Hinthialibacter antarcticus]|nr:sodium:solute symporter family protein [Candidatus Hinthialibacter antarcticus]